MNTEYIAFFSAENLFRKKTPETMRKAFDDMAESFAAEFEEPLTDEHWQMVLQYQSDLAKAKLERERAKLEREAAKAAKLASMPIASGIDSAHDTVTKMPPGVYVLAAAQNNTHIDKTFLDCLLNYCNARGAKLLLGKMLYNKKAFRQPGADETDDLWFDDAIKPYLVEGTIDLGGYHFLADANVIPTAKWPASGFDGATPSGVHAIIPASKMELRTTAALKGAASKVIAATGAVTKRNYIMRKTGQIAAHAHSISAVVVDTIAGTLRHIELMPGCDYIFDLNEQYFASGDSLRVSGHIAAYQFGDIHAEKMTGKNWARAINAVELLQPDNIILHDLLDFSSRNHHNIKDCVFVHRQFIEGNTVEQDIRTVAQFLLDIGEVATGNIQIIESNHDLAINTWLRNADFKVDPINAVTYLTCMLEQYKATQNGESINMLETALRKIAGMDTSAIVFHETDDSVMLAGVEMGNHGHNGANGARGNPKGFANMGIAMNTGHTHSPSIYGKVFTAGVAASLEMGYNVGPSSWAIADVITYENGQRQIIFA